MIRSADVRTDSETRQWEARLNREWPQREQVAACIVAQINSDSVSSPRVVELACGAGYLAEALFRQQPDARYCGFDLSPHLLDYARRRLVDYATRPENECEIEFRCADLVRDDWDEQIMDMGWAGQVDAVVSLQALHDLGGLTQQRKVLARARQLLRPGGVLAYGDLLLDAKNPHPSRFTAVQHKEMLRAAGFVPDNAAQLVDSAGAVRFGSFGCFRSSK
jgi:SAM-dependent methyltransferase